jgi:hypothetical protein
MVEFHLKEEQQAIVVKRGIADKLRVFLVWLVLAGIWFIVSNALGTRLFQYCVRVGAPPEDCALAVKGTENVVTLTGFMGAGLLVRWKLRRDAHIRYLKQKAND